MIQTIQQAMSRSGIAIVIFSHHRPKYQERDMQFFNIAQEEGFMVTKLFDERMVILFLFFLSVYFF